MTISTFSKDSFYFVASDDGLFKFYCELLSELQAQDLLVSLIEEATVAW